MPTAAQAMNPSGNEPNLVGPKKPMGGLTMYPGTNASEFRLPEESELRLVMTDPPESTESGITINLKFNTYSGSNVPVTGHLTPAHEAELKQYVTYGREWEDGPVNVDDSSILPNNRGFRNLSGNIFKLTSTPYSHNGVGLVVLGGFWDNHPLNCRAACRYRVHSEEASRYVGLRLSRTIW